MYMQTRSAESRFRYAATGVLAMLLVVAATFPAISQEPEDPEPMELRGIYMNPGDTMETAITPVGDEDMIVFDAPSWRLM